MDPLTALSVAGTVVQLVDFGTKLLSTTVALYQSANGALAVNVQLDMAITDLSSVGRKLSHEGNLDPDLEDICRKTDVLAAEFLAKLGSLQVEGNSSRAWKSFRQAVNAAWSKDELASLKNRMDLLRQAIDTKLLVSLRGSLEHISIQTSQRFDNLDKQTQQIVKSLLEDRTTVDTARAARVDKIDHQTLAIIQILSRIETDNANAHAVTRATIRDVAYQVKDQDGVMNGPHEPMLTPGPLGESQTRAAVSLHILESLCFPSMTHRYEQVGEAYSNTFSWIFNKNTSMGPNSSNFVEWLSASDGKGLYWIKGKAGSGKSTLMRFLVDEPLMKQYLRQWADAAGFPLCIATFFFWNSGTAQQKSQEGLLRCLLYQVLSEHPQLIPIILPSIWANFYSKAVSWHSLQPQHWTLAKLRAAFESLVKQTSYPLRLSFFIDGLDEFDGDHEQLSELFKRISTKENVKTCVSSRPWVVFDDCFENLPRLRLQDLTKSDIKHYVGQEIDNHPAFKKLALEYPAETADLVLQITEKADGVFLWVTIVVSSLLKGIRNRDSVQDLQKRLLQFPKDLEPLYRHMLDLIDDFYAESSSQIFQIVKSVREAEAVWSEIESLTTLRLYFAVHPEVCSKKGGASLKDISENMEVQLTARCAGLLEVMDSHKLESLWQKKFSIVYLHRTARDFIESPVVWKELLSRTASTEFHPIAIMVRSSVSQLAYRCNSVQNQESETEVDPLWKEAMRYAYIAELQTNVPQTAPLDELAHILPRYYQPKKFLLGKDLAGHYPSGIPTQLLVVAMEWDLAAYICEKIKTSGSSDLGELATILLEKINLSLPDSERPSGQLGISYRTGVALLDIGALPNRKYMSKSPWEMFLTRLREQTSEPRYTLYVNQTRQYSEYAVKCVGLAGKFLTSGANPNVSLKAYGVDLTVEAIINGAFHKVLKNHETSHLFQQLQRRREELVSVPKHGRLFTQGPVAGPSMRIRERSLTTWIKKRLRSP